MPFLPYLRALPMPFLILLPTGTGHAQAPAAALDAGNSDILVTARAEKLYCVNESEIGKVAADPMDIPQSVQVITSELIRDQGARDITDLYRNVAGVSANQYATVTYRGFRQEAMFYDGLRGDPFQGFAVPNLFSIERVEFLKGPVGMLYGASSPGGMVNYVTKKPKDVFAASVRAIVGNYDRIGGSAELTGPIDAHGVVSGRAGLFYERYDTVQRFSGSRSLVADGGLTFHLAPDTSLTVQATRYDQKLPGNRLRGVAIDADGHFLADRNWTHNEKSDRLDLTGTVLQARFDSKLSDAVSLNASGRWFRYKEYQRYHEPLGPVDTDGDGVVDTQRREFRSQNRDIEGLSLATNLVAKLETGGVRHTVLAGADWYRETADFRGVTISDVPGLSLTNPVYGLSNPTAAELAGLTPSITATRAHRYGIYAQEQADIGDHVILVGGVRRDWFDDEDRIGGDYAEGGRWSWRVGGIYKPVKAVSLYGSYSQSFEPQDAGNQNPAVGGPFAPISSRQYEVGAKGALLNGQLQPTVALYHIVRNGIVQVDPDLPPVGGLDQLSPVGEVTSKGIELTLSADISKNWVLTANYAYNDARITDSAPGATIDNAVGGRFPNAPRHQAGLWSRYQIAPLGAAVALGAQYVSGQIDRRGAHIPGFTVYDGSVTKDLGFAEAMLRVENIFDKSYAVATFDARKGAFVGRPRTVFLELRRDF
ncbi:TonB-dependent receptor [Sphingobium sp.]|uniref:TonB-dependent siderophore receptor n=1 Tax=Sphingobium sp. TaxID=1912891 RepID=UPI002CCCE3E6|nr:TonB-dependent receptor [Sphingobium sp.]HUD94989.1 TonB-dependent receptor [Sphingobium sp.]